MKLFISLLICGSCLFGCNDEDDQSKEPDTLQWKKLGLDGKSVNQMLVSGTTLYVATTTGMFKRELNNANADFAVMGFAGKNVQAVEIINNDEILISLFDKSGGEEPALYKTNDDGINWLLVESNFGGDFPEPVFDFALNPGDESILLASGFGVVAKSLDGGLTWEPIYGEWGAFGTGVSVVTFNKNATEEIWAGGQGAIENGFLIRSVNEREWDEWTSLVENPTVVKEITFTPGNRDRIFVGWEGALLRTVNSGQTWQTLIESEENKFFFGICTDDENPDLIFAGGWIKTPEPQPLILMISRTGGDSWEEFELTGETYGGILDMQIRHEEGKDVLYLGLDKGGIYEVTSSGF